MTTRAARADKTVTFIQNIACAQPCDCFAIHWLGSWGSMAQATCAQLPTDQWTELPDLQLLNMLQSAGGGYVVLTLDFGRLTCI